MDILSLVSSILILISLVGSYFLYKKYHKTSSSGSEDDQNAAIANYLRDQEATKAANASTKITVPRITLNTDSTLCLEAMVTRGGIATINKCSDDASWKHQIWQFNSDGTVSTPDKSLCLYSTATLQVPPSTDPTKTIIVNDDINGAKIVAMPCGGDRNFVWRNTSNQLRQDNGLNRDKCWTLEKDAVAAESKIVTWYCDNKSATNIPTWNFTNFTG